MNVLQLLDADTDDLAVVDEIMFTTLGRAGGNAANPSSAPLLLYVDRELGADAYRIEYDQESARHLITLTLLPGVAGEHRNALLPAWPGRALGSARRASR